MSKDFGGRMTFRLSTGQLFSLRGTFKINPTRMNITALTNQDGSIDRSGEMKPATFEFNFSDGGIDLDVLMAAPRFDVTAIEQFSGVTHFLTKAFMSGDPSVDRITGEVTGLTGNAEHYRRTGN